MAAVKFTIVRSSGRNKKKSVKDHIKTQDFVIVSRVGRIEYFHAITFSFDGGGAIGHREPGGYGYVNYFLADFNFRLGGDHGNSASDTTALIRLLPQILILDVINRG